MNRWKKFTFFVLAFFLLAGAVVFFRWISQPRESEIERLFDGTEVIFVEGRGLLSAWRAAGRTDYWQGRMYEGFQDLPPIRDLLDRNGGSDGAWVGRITVDTVMSAVGDEAALGIYEGGGRPRFLFVSRVDPNFLLVDRLLSFAEADAGITITPYRGLRVKEATFGPGRSLMWALDGDLLLLSNEAGTLYAALDRRVDGTSGRIEGNRNFRRMKRDEDITRLISGYAVTGRLASVVPAAEKLPDAVRRLSGPIRFGMSYDGRILAVHAEGAGAFDPRSLFPRRGRWTSAEPGDGVLAATVIGRMPPPGRDADPYCSGSGPAAVMPHLFPDGFSLLVVTDPDCAGQPGIIGIGEGVPSFETVIDLLGPTSVTERTVTDAGIDCRVFERDGVVCLAWAGRDGRTVVSDRCESVSGISAEILETGGGLGYTTADGEIVLVFLPRRAYRELERCGKPLPIPSGSLSLDEQKRLLAALYVAERIDGYAAIGRNSLVIDIAVYIEDAIP